MRACAAPLRAKARHGRRFIEAVLHEWGAKEPRAHVLAPEPEGEASGYETFRVPFEVRWRS